MRHAASGACQAPHAPHAEIAAVNARLACQRCCLLIGLVSANQHALVWVRLPSRCNQWGRGPPPVCCQPKGHAGSCELAAGRSCCAECTSVKPSVPLLPSHLPSARVTALSPDRTKWVEREAVGGAVLRAGAPSTCWESICQPSFHHKSYDPMGEWAEESRTQ